MGANLDFQIRSYDDIRQDLQDEIANQQTGLTGKAKLTDFSFGSVISIIIRSVAAVLARAWTFLQSLVSIFYISTAVGDALKRRFADFGFSMIVGTQASGQVQVVRTAGGAFTGSVNVGDLLYFGPTQFQVIAASSAFGTPSTSRTARAITVQASVNGSIANLGANTTLISLDQQYQGLIFVVGTALDSSLTNATQGGLAGGVDDETPDAARLRFQSYIQNLGKGTIQAIQSAVLAVPGVRACTVYDTTRLSGSSVREPGYPGYIVVQVQPVTIVGGGTLDPALLSSIESAVNASKAAGIHFDVQPVAARVIDVAVSVGTSLLSTSADFLALEAQIQQTLLTAFNSLAVNDPMYTRVVDGQMSAINPTAAPGGISAVYTYDVNPNAGLAATDANGKITPDSSGNGQILALGTVTVTPVSL